MHGFGILFNVLADLETVHARHHDIEKDDVRRLRVNDFERTRPVICRQNVKILACQLRFQKLDVRQQIIDDEDSRGHFPLAQKAIDSRQKIRNRDRFRDVGFAATFPELLFIALHGESGDGNDRDLL